MKQGYQGSRNYFCNVNLVNYERIDITPNGTTIEITANQTKYYGMLKVPKFGIGTMEY